MQPHYGNIMSIKIPYMRRKISTILTLSAIALLLSSPLMFFNFVQLVQAQTTLSFRTTQTGANGTLCTNDKATLTFEATGTPSSSNPQHAGITSGTFQVTNSSGVILYSGNIHSGSFINNTSGGSLGLDYEINRSIKGACGSGGEILSLSTVCSTANFNDISIHGSTGYDFGDFSGAVECSRGGDTISSMTGNAQDSDGDGIPDSSDRCTHNSNHRCFRESE